MGEFLQYYPDMLQTVNCIETGLSADPLMIRKISELNKVFL
ncbi:MAG: hypothetical protein V3V33_03875 [Candidatus Lokiarchaeia archaeon]